MVSLQVLFGGASTSTSTLTLGEHLQPA